MYPVHGTGSLREGRTDHLESHSGDERVNGFDVGYDSKDGVTDEAPRRRGHSRGVHRNLAAERFHIYVTSRHTKEKKSASVFCRTVDLTKAPRGENQPFGGEIVEVEGHSHCNKTLSPAVTNAQTFGAQYAWFNPLVNGNSLESNCGN